jgi:hypothetical protein
MISMKVNYKMQDNVNKEFEHDEELSLISEKNMMKMHMIGHLSILNLFQMKLMKVIFNMKSILNKEFEYDEEL